MRSNTAKITYKPAVVLCAAVISSAAFTSCSVYRDYERGEVAVVDSLYSSADSTSLGAIGWRSLFTDPALQDLIDSALVHNADILCARERVLQAKASLRASKMAFLPAVNLPFTYNWANSEERYGGNVSGYAVPATASWEIDLSGKLLVGKRKAQAALEQSEVAVRSVQTELIATVAEMYYTLGMLHAKLAISESTAKSWQENVRIMRSMKQAGMTNEASVSQTEANACSIETSLFDLQYQIAQTTNNLSALVGIAPGHVGKSNSSTSEAAGANAVATSGIPAKAGSAADAGTSVATSGIPALTTGVPAQLLSRRPDVRAAELELQKCFYDKALAHAAFYPSLTLNGEYGWEKALTSPEGWLISAGAGLTQPLFRRGALTANLRVAESREREAAISFRQALLRAGAEVNNALVKCQTVEAKRTIREQQIEALQNAEKSTASLMRHSESTYLEVLTAQQSLLSARLQQVTDQFDLQSGIIELYRALGGGAEE